MLTLTQTPSPSFNLSEIFTNAWSIVREKSMSLSEALRSAWAAAKAAVKKLAINVEKLAELNIQELIEIRAVIEAQIAIKESGQEPEEKKFSHAIKLEEEGGKIAVTSHYNEAFVEKARGLRGSFLGGKWYFDESVRSYVISAMEECYGVTGIYPYEVVTLLVKDFSESIWKGGSSLFGRPVAKAYGRDSGAKAGDGIFLIKGKFRSGGSVKNWQTQVVDATFEMHDFPVAALAWEDVKSAIEEGWVEVK